MSKTNKDQLDKIIQGKPWEKELTMVEIANKVNWRDVKSALEYYYPIINDKRVNWNRYKPVFERIKSFKKKRHADKEEKIEVGVGGMRVPYPGDSWLDEAYYCNTNKYSLSFRSWKSVSNIPVSIDSIKHFKYAELLAHFIWEITWYGPESEMIEKKKELHQSFKQFLKQKKKK